MPNRSGQHSEINKPIHLGGTGQTTQHSSTTKVVVAMDETAVASPHERGSNFSPGKGVRPSSSPLRGDAWGASAVNGARRGPIVGTVISSA